MVHASEATASIQNRDRQSTTDCCILKSNKSLPHVVDVAAGQANKIPLELEGAVSQRLTQALRRLCSSREEVQLQLDFAALHDQVPQE